MKPELKELFTQIKTKINDEEFFKKFVGEIVNEANYNNYYEQTVADEEIAEQLVESYFIENYKDEDELQLLKNKIMQILFFTEGDEKLVNDYATYVDEKINNFLKDITN